MSKFSKSSAALTPSVRKNPPHYFVSKVRKVDKVDGPDANKSERIKLEFLKDPDIPALQVLLTVLYLQGWMQYPEEWIKWVVAFREIENLMPMKEPADKTRILHILLKGQNLSYFEHHLRLRVEAEESERPDNDLIELVVREL
jgi:hypothetical protein